VSTKLIDQDESDDEEEPVFDFVDIELPEELELLDDETFDLSGVSSDDTVGLYLKEMARVPLLTTEEEVDLARRLEEGNLACRRLRNLKDSASAEDRTNYENAVEDGKLAREHLIKANTRLVVSIAKKYMGQGVPFLDLIQEGTWG
jgi:RNA polymerase primary sigma factor